METRLAEAQVEARPMPATVLEKRRLGLVHFVGLIMLCLTMLVLSDVTIARMGEFPQLPDIPQAYFPGNPLPKDVSCASKTYGYVECSIPIGDRVAFLNFDPATRLIISTVIPARDYTIGQFIMGWGAPSGIHKSDYAISVHWGTRSALVYTRSLKPQSRVEFILYDLEAQQTASPWRGFRRP